MTVSTARAQQSNQRHLAAADRLTSMWIEHVVHVHPVQGRSERNTHTHGMLLSSGAR